MKTLFIIIFLFLTGYVHSQPGTVTKQKPPEKINVTATTIVKDTSGTIYQYDIWKKLLMTGYYRLKPENAGDKNTAFLLIRLSDEERKRNLENSPKPKESKSFTTGAAVKNFSTTDIDGIKYKLKDLKGKIVVLNFWFINCPPCQAEILELNKLVKEYKDSSNIVFLAIALDSKSDLKNFLRTNPYSYTVIDSGRDIANQYEVTSYPTHVVIDKEGKAYFHTTGAGSSISYWLKKSIDELMIEK